MIIIKIVFQKQIEIYFITYSSLSEIEHMSVSMCVYIMIDLVLVNFEKTKETYFILHFNYVPDII